MSLPVEAISFDMHATFTESSGAGGLVEQPKFTKRIQQLGSKLLGIRKRGECRACSWLSGHPRIACVCLLVKALFTNFVRWRKARPWVTRLRPILGRAACPGVHDKARLNLRFSRQNCPIQRGFECQDLQWLREEIIHSRVHTRFPVLFHDIGRQSNDVRLLVIR